MPMDVAAFASATVRERRRRGQPLGDTATAACTAFLTASRAAQGALERMELAQRRDDLAHDENEELERVSTKAWEAMYLAALELDAVLPGRDEDSAAELVRLLAGMHNRRAEWDAYLQADGTRFYMERGHITAVLTASGEVVPGPRFRRGKELPPPPPPPPAGDPRREAAWSPRGRLDT